MKLIFSEAVILSLVGGLMGIVIGVGIAVGLEHIELMRGKIDAIFSISFFFTVLGLSVLLGVLGGFYPAFKAARLLPSAALRHE